MLGTSREAHIAYKRTRELDPTEGIGKTELLCGTAAYLLPEKICGIDLVYFRLVPGVSSFPGLYIPQVQHRSILEASLPETLFLKELRPEKDFLLKDTPIT